MLANANGECIFCEDAIDDHASEMRFPGPTVTP